MKPLSIFSTILLLSLSSFGYDAAAEPYTHPSTGLVFPDRLAGMEKGTVKDFETEHPGLGVSVGYNGPGLTLTIFVYTLGLAKVPNDLASPILTMELSKAIGGVRGTYKDMKITSSGDVLLGASKASPKALAASFDYTHQGVKRQSELYLTGYHDHFFKVRFTYIRPVQAAVAKTRVELREELGKMM